jgi:hypothetical protein
MSRHSIRLRWKLFLRMITREILYPSILLVVILYFYVKIGKTTYYEIFSNYDIFFKVYLLIIALPICFMFEYLLFSLFWKIIIVENEVKIIAFGKIKKVINRSEILRLTEYCETYSIHFLPTGFFRYGVFDLKDGSYYIINSLQYENFNDLVLKEKYSKNRNILPSITLYHIYRFFADRS